MNPPLFFIPVQWSVLFLKFQDTDTDLLKYLNIRKTILQWHIFFSFLFNDTYVKKTQLLRLKSNRTAKSDALCSVDLSINKASWLGSMGRGQTRGGRPV